MSTFRPEIESLRGVAAFSVVLAHCFINFHFHPQTGFLDGDWTHYVNFLLHVLFNENAAIVIFFVLSGFVLSIQLEHIAAPAWKKVQIFVVRRFFRIAPAMWFAVVVAYSLRLIYGEQDEPRLFLLGMLFQGKHLIGPLWTITIEMACSLIFPALYFASRRGLAVNLAMLAFTYWLVGNGSVPEWARYAFFFQLGLMVQPYGKLFAHRWILAGALAVYAFAAPLAATFDWPITLWLRLTGGASFVILANVVHGRAFAAALNLPAARFIGRISYSLYLIHYVVMELVVRASGIVGWDAHPLVGQLLIFTATAPLSIGIAACMHEWIEVPANRFGKTVSSGRLALQR